MSRTVALVADAGERVGLGHLARCSAIASALRARGVAVAPYAYGPVAPTIDGISWMPIGALGEVEDGSAGALVLDSYLVESEEAAALARNFRVCALDDIGNAPSDAALLVRVQPPAASSDPRILAGLRHAPLRSSFWGLPEREAAEGVRRVLVSMGGGPDAGDAALEAARAALAAVPEAEVSLVRGPSASFEPPPGVGLVDASDSLLAELLGTDLLVTAGGQTSLEAAATGTPSIVRALVENQAGNVRALAEAGAALPVESAAGGLPAALEELAGDAETRATLSRRAQAAVDGYGALRIAFHVERLLDG